ncbi:MAG: imidazoleglycerol-phosphate dehydratase HisB [Vicinamibacteria bacterium]|jgi:imidazoleglycerol-phosphate dehydratase|nr:imidazoleglycerol-phosphate dehydratase HisB [Vicinamibacteria bacterium]
MKSPAPSKSSPVASQNKPTRRAILHRKTRETDIHVDLDLDGQGTAEVSTGIGFFDHMLSALALHARFDLKVNCKGDLHVDTHHSVEDVGIVLGDALLQALGEKKGIARFGHAYVPLDEALARAVVDLSGRAYLHFDVPFSGAHVGALPTEMIADFFRALSDRARINLHVDLLRGRNAHHVTEAVFKAVARALATAVAIEARHPHVPSTKGTL